MTAKEIKDSIQIQVKHTEDGMIHVIGRVQIGYAAQPLNKGDERFIDEAKDVVKEGILRTIYSDQREAIRKALYDLLSVEPWNFSKMVEAKELLLEAAKTQPPHDWK